MTKKDVSPHSDESQKRGFHVVDDDDDKVENWMNPVIFNVKSDTPMSEIARRMVRYGIHHIFVKGHNEEPLVGIVSSFDVLKQVAAGSDEE